MVPTMSGIPMKTSVTRDSSVSTVGVFGLTVKGSLKHALETGPRQPVGRRRHAVEVANLHGMLQTVASYGLDLIEDIERAAASLGLSHRLVGIRFLASSVLGLAQDRKELAGDLAALANACAREDGAESVLFGGAPFAGIGRELAARGGASVEAIQQVGGHVDAVGADRVADVAELLGLRAVEGTGGADRLAVS